MSNHDASYMLNEVLFLLDEYGFFNRLAQEETIAFANAIAKIGCCHDCNDGEIFNEIGRRLKYCYCCGKFSEELDDYGICKECT